MADLAHAHPPLSPADGGSPRRRKKVPQAILTPKARAADARRAKAAIAEARRGDVTFLTGMSDEQLLAELTSR